MRRVSDDAAPRCIGVAIVVLLHAAALAVLLNVEALRSAVTKTAPVFVSLIAPQPPKTLESLAPMSQKSAPKRVQPRRISPHLPASAFPTELAVLSPAPAPIESALAEPQVSAIPSPPVPAIVAPKVISNVEYVRAPRVEYPVASRRLREEGRVVLRVLISRSGRAEQVEIQTSSGSTRLDEAAIKAARDALYRPYSENGEVISVWALVPTLFELS